MARSGLARRWRAAGVAGGVVALGALAGCVLVGGAAWRAWLGAAFLASSLPAGSLVLVMTMRLIPGAWAREASPILEAQSLLLPVSALAFVPVLVALPTLYRWTGEPQPTAFRTAWLSPGAFIAVTVAWIGALALLAGLLVRRPGAPRAVACLGLIAVLVLGTFAATDWVQSLDPAFNSSGFGLYLLSLQVVTALATAIVAALAGSGEGLPRQGIIGGLLLTVLLLWAYFAFMPYFISWSGNAPAAAAWYLPRGRGVWGDLAWLVAATRLAPAFLLLFRAVRNGRRWLLAIAATVALGAAPEVAWLVLPAPPGGAAPDLVSAALFVAAVAGLGVLCAALLQPAWAWTQATPR